MQIFAKEPDQPNKIVSPTVAPSTSGPVQHKHSILRLQRTIGNQAVLRMLRARAAESEAGLTPAESPRLGHDTSRTPIYPPAPAFIQTKLTINRPGDEYEQEADHVAEQVMRMPAPVHAPPMALAAPLSLQPKCVCGDTCDKCQANRKEDDHDEEELQRSPADSSQRSAQNLSTDRAQTDEKARVAHSVQARSYLVGRDAVFGPGRYASMFAENSRLTTHESVHVLQRDGNRDDPTIRRSPAPKVDPLDIDEIRGELKSLEQRAAEPRSLSPADAALIQTEREVLRQRLREAVRARASLGSASEPLPEMSSWGESAVAPEDMVRIILDQRHFGAGKPGRSIPDDALTDVARGKQAGYGFETNAAIQIVDAEGRQVAFELAKFAGGGPHAEPQALARLRLRLRGAKIAGGKLVVAVDQYACPECLPRLSEFAREVGLSGYEVWAPMRGEGTPKTAAKTSATRPAAMEPGETTPGYRSEPQLVQGETFLPKVPGPAQGHSGSSSQPPLGPEAGSSPAPEEQAKSTIEGSKPEFQPDSVSGEIPTPEPPTVELPATPGGVSPGLATGVELGTAALNVLNVVGTVKFAYDYQKEMDYINSLKSGQYFEEFWFEIRAFPQGAQIIMEGMPAIIDKRNGTKLIFKDGSVLRAISSKKGGLGMEITLPDKSVHLVDKNGITDPA